MKKLLIGFTLMAAMMTINKTATAQTSGNQSNWNTPILTNIIPASSPSGTSGSSSGLIMTNTPIVITPTTLSPIPPIELSSGIVLQSATSILFPETPVAPTESGVYSPGAPTGVTVSPGGAVNITFAGFDAGSVIIFSGGENFAASLG